MVASSLMDFNSRAWTRKILNNYWFVLILSIVVECISMVLSSTDHWTFFVWYVLLPSGLLTAIIASAELFARIGKADYAVLVAADFMATVIVATHSTVPVTSAVFVVPILVSVFYFEPRKVVVTDAVCLVCVILLYILDPDFRTSASPIGIVSLSAIIIGGCVIALEVMERGVELVDHLQETQASNQLLQVKNIVMESMSKLDELTGAYNHKTFHEHLGELIARSTAFEESIYLLLADIDDFKQVNDTFGHHIGDVILHRVAQCIKSELSANDFLARYGGEEFAVIMVRKTPDDARQTADRIGLSIASQVHEEIGDRVVTVSMGISQYEGGKGKQSLFVSADQALYRAKHSGKNQVIFA